MSFKKFKKAFGSGLEATLDYYTLKKTYVCKDCGYVGKPKKKQKVVF